jgi:beta-lactamase class A
MAWLRPTLDQWNATIPAISQFVAEQPGRAVGLYVSTMKPIYAGPEGPLPAASLTKIPLAVAALGLLGKSPLIHGQTVADELRLTRYPSILGAFPPGTSLSAETIVGLSLISSDNDCANWLIERLPQDAFSAVCHELGLTQTILGSGFSDDECTAEGRANLMSIRDAISLLRTLHDDARLEPVERLLRDNLRNQRIPGLLEDAFPVAHKTGTLMGVAADIGLLHSSYGSVALAVLSDQQPDVHATSAAIARLAYAVCSELSLVP